jgi:hypothetical protein
MAPSASSGAPEPPEGYQNDDPSRSNRVVLTDEPADEIPAPNLGELIDRGDRGRILRDRYHQSPVGRCAL